ncbi:hypothetical protein ATL17_2446 [Maritalea mobilis]|uniref:ClpP protease-like protein n=1 Tax=Maritalea mobilis TaxID=483324 RepID=A0A4R6VMW6_9HYPH|nr:hypothetical protein [Maritalea mobilis]TDQ64427.1 hypothetical protein ATL17_2446 [Maritalea mobilis]
MNWHRVVLAFCSLLLSGSTSFGAEIKLISMHYSADRFAPHIRFEGPVVAGDNEKLVQLIERYIECDTDDLPVEGGNCGVISLNSPGGNYREGLMLANTLRQFSIASVVQAGDYCYSACAFAFLGGSGYSTQISVGTYVDRMVEPAATLGFHAPYIAADSLDTLVAEFGMEEVLGSTRDEIALMIQELVSWNVDKQVLAYIVSMGPDQTYDVVLGEDFYLTRSQLPPAPVSFWNSDKEDRVRNACIYLLAHHFSRLPSGFDEIFDMPFLENFAKDSNGQMLSGYQLDHANPLQLSYCGLPTAQLKQTDELDIALYNGPGVTGAVTPLLSMFSRNSGWSTLGLGGSATQRIFQRDAMTQAFTNPTQVIDGSVLLFTYYLQQRRFATLNELGEIESNLPLPATDLSMQVIDQSAYSRILQRDNLSIIEQVGSPLLFNMGKSEFPTMNMKFTHQSISETGFIFAGKYPNSGAKFAWVGLLNDYSSLIRIEEIAPDGSDDFTSLYQIACSYSFAGVQLKCAN